MRDCIVWGVGTREACTYERLSVGDHEKVTSVYSGGSAPGYSSSCTGGPETQEAISKHQSIKRYPHAV